MALSAQVPAPPLTIQSVHSSVECLDQAITHIDDLLAKGLNTYVDQQLRIIKEYIRDGKGPIKGALDRLPGYPYVYGL